MRELLGGVAGERMDLGAYRADFERTFWATTEPGFWKLERQQFFKEPGNGSWEAFAKGDWEESLRILEAGRHDMADYYRRSTPSGPA